MKEIDWKKIKFIARANTWYDDGTERNYRFNSKFFSKSSKSYKYIKRP